MQHHPLTCGCPLLIAKYEPCLHARSYISAGKRTFSSAYPVLPKQASLFLISSFTQTSKPFPQHIQFYPKQASLSRLAHNCEPITPLKGTHMTYYGLVFSLVSVPTGSVAIGIFRLTHMCKHIRCARHTNPFFLY